MKQRSERLGRVLRVREVQEQEARATWLAAEGVARQAEEQVALLRDACAGMAEQLGDSVCDLPVAWVLLSHDQIDRTQRRSRDEHERALTLRDQADLVRAPWIERRAAARGLERLVERTRANEWAEELARDASALDEITAARTKRRGGNENCESER